MTHLMKRILTLDKLNYFCKQKVRHVAVAGAVSLRACHIPCGVVSACGSCCCSLLKQFLSFLFLFWHKSSQFSSVPLSGVPNDFSVYF